jgi:quercetin dioxygenase-like cupin family protein
MPSGQVYWHLYNYPTRAAADANKTANGTVIESFGKIWLYTIAKEGWRPPSGERVAVIGPFSVTAGRRYTARYMEAHFTPGMKAAVHRHSGPEAWYLVAGTQCLETPEGFKVAHAGEGAVVPEGPPMALSSVGTETRRSVLLVRCVATLDHDGPPLAAERFVPKVGGLSWSTAAHRARRGRADHRHSGFVPKQSRFNRGSGTTT